MLKKQFVNTFYSKNFLSKYTSVFSYINDQNKSNKTHQPHFKNVLCKYFVQKMCTRGEDCIFSHKIQDFTKGEIEEAGKIEQEVKSETTLKFWSPFS